MSFWLNKPIHIKNNVEPGVITSDFSSNLIMSPDELLQNCTMEINTSRIQLDYNLILDPDDETKHHLVKFINNNYDKNDSHLVLQYSKSLLDYFINPDSLCIVFYPLGHLKSTTETNCFDKMIGLIIAKKHTLSIRESQKPDSNLSFKNYETIDVDFLCLVKQLRNLHISSYMINVVTKECLIQYDKQVSCAIYTINKQLRVKNFSKKTFYHRPLQIDRLILSNMLNISYNDPSRYQESYKIYKKIYNTFNYHKNFFIDFNLEYYNQIQVDEQLLNFIHDKLSNYNKTNYYIFESKSKDDITKILQNPTFHKFIIRMNGTNEIVDFICMYNLNTLNKTTNTFIECGHLYSMFLHNNSNTYFYNVLEVISEYCYTNKLFDELIITNILDIPSDKYKTYKLLKGSGELFYYIYNVDIPIIQSYQNGLVTI